jgi:hypothetical protein
MRHISTTAPIARLSAAPRLDVTVQFAPFNLHESSSSCALADPGAALTEVDAANASESG